MILPISPGATSSPVCQADHPDFHPHFCSFSWPSYFNGKMVGIWEDVTRCFLLLFELEEFLVLLILCSFLTPFSDILIICFFSYHFPIEAIYNLLGLSRNEASVLNSNLPSFNLSLLSSTHQKACRGDTSSFSHGNRISKESPCEKENICFSSPFLSICPLSRTYTPQ